MKKSFRSMAWIMIALIVCMTFASPAALAESSRVRELTMSARVRITGDVPEELEKYYVVMEADDASYPMPEGSENGKYTLKMTGARSKEFPVITYDRVGIYTYKLYQIAGTNENCRYDDAVYTMTVYILNDGEGGFDIMAVLHAPDEEHKPDEVEFINHYKDQGDGTPTGVNDSWPIFLACSVVLLAVGILLFWWIRRRDEDEDEFDLDEE